MNVLHALDKWGRFHGRHGSIGILASIGILPIGIHSLLVDLASHVYSVKFTPCSCCESHATSAMPYSKLLYGIAAQF